MLTMISNYIDSHNIEGAIDYIDTFRSKIRVEEVDKALKRFGENPRKYRYKNDKIDALINVLRNYKYGDMS